MHDLFSSFFGPGGEQDRIFAWLWPVSVAGYLIGFGWLGTPDFIDFEVKSFGHLLMVSSGFGTVTTFALFALGAVVAWVLSKLEK